MLLLESPALPPYNSAHRAFRRPPGVPIVTVAAALLPLLVAPITTRAQQSTPVLLDAMTTELHRAFTSLAKSPAASISNVAPSSSVAPNLVSASADATSGTAPTPSGTDQQLPPYFLSYSVSEASFVAIRAQYGALTDSSSGRTRVADVQVRVGSSTLDNTHGTHRGSAVNTLQLPLGDDREALMRSLWLATNTGYGNALDNYLRVKTESQVRAKEEDTSPDFSRQTPQTYIGPVAPPVVIDRASWEQRVRELSKIFRDYPDVYQNMVLLTVQNETDYFASSEGSQIVTPHLQARLVVAAVTRADDGMDLFREQTFEAETVDGLPKPSDLEAAMRALGQSLEALRKAPVTEPFDGPAILSGRAAAVFFHEVLGHRLEGQRQRGDEEGQTFTKDVGKDVLPSFLSVVDDPTQTTFGNIWLSGSYQYDDEGQKAERVDLIHDGVLKNFLMSRLPIASFDESNGHGRAETGHVPTGRQGNLIVTSTKTVSEADLRKDLIDEAKKQGKPYGLYFEDISSGFAVTQRNSPQAFQVIPLVVWRVYVDGRPDELVRGVSIVGTPLAAMKSILATGDKSEVFNGECGAESGTVPVSAVAPAMLLSSLETQRQPQGTARPPILPIPGADSQATAAKEAQ
ncbi:Peptidase U62 modulator of DNA gyrase [Candidatus Sulfotelmatomonas gaucii]|uniref:Peptidase U62 modulator of DNA gyrase n=1 Tax=Candidatus Sulfuritelmatomonas gaucii TaxID=2043161 RepID=A0A2N9L7J0_9BACT|nr:Peptidase U62 modulator of DNA gyrase [Candidatus Sulfotelmatomonas gaucii]